MNKNTCKFCCPPVPSNFGAIFCGLYEMDNSGISVSVELGLICPAKILKKLHKIERKNHFSPNKSCLSRPIFAKQNHNLRIGEIAFADGQFKLVPRVPYFISHIRIHIIGAPFDFFLLFRHLERQGYFSKKIKIKKLTYK